MSTVLDQICARKAEHVQARKAALPLDELKTRLAGAPPPRGFIDALRMHHAPSIIAEIKKASPSKGVIRDDFDPVETAHVYEQNGAACLSVLTDEPYFQGRDAYLQQIRVAGTLPVLRKDFMIDPYQIYESRALGADCVLLIMAALGDEQAQELHALALDLRMDVLVEVHDLAELERAKTLNPAMIGVNNRNLKTLEVDLATSRTLLPHIPDTVLKVAESGLSTKADIDDLTQAGFNAFLIGESLMREADIGAALRALL